MDENIFHDHDIIARFFARDERALDAVAKKYARLYRSIFGALLRDQSDIEECSNDLLLSLWQSIPPHRPRSLPTYISALARRIGIDRYRYNSRQKRGEGGTLLFSELQDAIPDRGEDSAQSEAERARLGAVLQDFLDGLDTTTRILFLRRYFYTESVSSLASRFEMSESAVSVRLHRARKKLKKRLEKEGLYS